MRLAQNPKLLAGVIGWPVAHSRSPLLHGTWLARHNINGDYLPLPVEPGKLAEALRQLPERGFIGANVTIPHKQAAAACCDALHPFAARVKAVNTLQFAGGKIIGSNTDGEGYLANLRAHGVNPAAGPALILGAGGAARAIGAALQDAGTAITFCNRTTMRAAALAADFPPAAILPWEQREAALKNFALLVNTTALGMQHQPALPMSLHTANPALTVSDIVYVPLETQLLQDARQRGLKAVEGLGMLLHQAVPGFEAWFGVRPEVDAELYRIVAADLL